jgi:hypothetical protein
LLLIGFFVVYRNQTGRKIAAAAPPLSAAEEKRLKALLDEGADG